MSISVIDEQRFNVLNSELAEHACYDPGFRKPLALFRRAPGIFEERTGPIRLEIYDGLLEDSLCLMAIIELRNLAEARYVLDWFRFGFEFHEPYFGLYEEDFSDYINQ